MRTSYLEIYNEEIRDLLGNDTKQKMEVRGRNSSETSVLRGKGEQLFICSLITVCSLLALKWEAYRTGYPSNRLLLIWECTGEGTIAVALVMWKRNLINS